MRYVRVVILSAVLLLSGFSFTHAGEVVFETEPSTQTGWGIQWGLQWETDTVTHSGDVSVRYTPTSNQNVCTVKLGLYKMPLTPDAVILTVTEGGTNPLNGAFIATKTLSADEVPVTPASDLIPTYSAFNFSPCLNLGQGVNYFFNLSRTQYKTTDPFVGENLYLSQIRNFPVYSQTSVWRYLQATQGWIELQSIEPAFRLEGPDTLAKEPIIIVPGMLGSRLNRVSDGEEVWPKPFTLTISQDDDHLNILRLDKYGREEIGNEMESIGIVETASPIKVNSLGLFGVYEDLISNFEDAGYVRSVDLILFDYDWRQNISSQSLELKNVVDSKSSISPTGKVSIVAHSMGGVLTKEYLRQNEEDLSRINNVVIAGAPQLGAVKAFNLLNFGDNLGIPVLNPNTAKEISQNMSAAYQLLPSREYINLAGGYVEDHRNQENRFLNYNETKSFMVNASRNELLLNLSEQFHQNLDRLNISGPRITNLVACNTKTLVGVKIFDNHKADIKLSKGDGTVPFISSRQVFSNADQSNYYAVRGFNHFDLVSKDEALDLIGAAATGNDIPILDDIKGDDSLCTFNARKFFLFSTHSPVNLRVYDEHGNYVGLNEGGDVNIGIPEGDFIRIEENNFVLVPEGQNYKAVVDAYATGSFDFKVKILTDDDKEDSAVYLNIPINRVNLNAELSFDGGLNDSLLNIDEDGNGSFDNSLTPNFVFRSGVVIEDPLFNIEGAYRLGWIEGKAREYLKKRLEQVSKLEKKDETKADEVEEILASLLKKLDNYLRQGLINQGAYDIIRGNLILLLND